VFSAHPDAWIVSQRNFLGNTICLSTLHHTIHHVLRAKSGSAKPGKCQYKRTTIHTKPKINHKAPQLTTNPEDHLFPQLTGPTNKLDFDLLSKAPSRSPLPSFELE
jgi:hypothetical protein